MLYIANYYWIGFRTRALWVGYEYYCNGKYDCCSMTAAHKTRNSVLAFFYFQHRNTPSHLLRFVRMAPRIIQRAICRNVKHDNQELYELFEFMSHANL
jgi:hypothetical protein